MPIPEFLEELIRGDDSLKQFINESNIPTNSTARMNQDRIISEIYFIKKLELSTDKLIESNKKLADSNKKYTIAMLILTAGLVFVGIANIFVSFCN